MLKKLINNIKIEKINILFFSILLQSFSFLSIKFATLSNGYVSILLLILTFVFLVLRAITWQIVLKFNPIAKVYPFNSLVQVLIFLYAVILFNESITIGNIIGLAFMIIGIILLGKNND